MDHFDKCVVRDTIVLTINSLLLLTEEEEEEEGMYILTNRLNEDPLENLFSSIRQRGGWNSNPTVRTFRSALRLYCLEYFIEPPSSSSYDIDESSILKVKQVQEPHHFDEAHLIGSMDDASESNETSSSGSEEASEEAEFVISEPVSLESCSQAYYAGYIEHVTQNKFKCEQCRRRHITSCP